MTTEPIESASPLTMDNIALAFSGGGFRAACFCLGTLSYLQHLQYKGNPLLYKVKFIGSTSGGSIANIIYSKYVFRKGGHLDEKEFKTFYDDLSNALDGNSVLDRAISLLTNHRSWGLKDKGRNLINAFSMAYDELLKGKKLNDKTPEGKMPEGEVTLDLFTRTNPTADLHEVCINATEFTNGLPFRFQSQSNGSAVKNGLIGNFYIHFSARGGGVNLGKKLKLSDILAASSCFPSGFEPIIFPEDFAHKDLSIEQLRTGIVFQANSFTLEDPCAHVLDTKDGEVQPHPDEDEPVPEKAQPNPEKDQPVSDRYLKIGNLDPLADPAFLSTLHIGMMDGGVDDNQAINCLVNAYERKGKNDKFDLSLICDVTSGFMDGYTLPMEKKGWVHAVATWIYLVFALLCILFLPAGWLLYPGTWNDWKIALGALSALFYLALIVYIIRLIVKKSTNRSDGSWKRMLKIYGPRFLLLRLGMIRNMFNARIKSVFMLANDVYLKQIRRMYYNAIFEDNRFKGRVVQNTIYDLSKVKFPNPSAVPAEPLEPATDPLEPPADLLTPSPNLINTAENARKIGTTLWFDPGKDGQEMKESIISTGKFTTCYNLLKYISEQPANTLNPVLTKVKTQLELDWKDFRAGKDPTNSPVKTIYDQPRN
jgi:hypothetical protein